MRPQEREVPPTPGGVENKGALRKAGSGRTKRKTGSINEIIDITISLVSAKRRGKTTCETLGRKKAFGQG